MPLLAARFPAMKTLKTQSGQPALGILRTRAEFLCVARGKRAAAKGLVLQWLEAPQRHDQPDTVRVGFTASKKVGGAVQRNRAKRRLREAARAVLADHGRPGTSYVMIARTETLTRPFTRLMGDLRWALARVHGEERKAKPERAGHVRRNSPQGQDN